MAKKGKSSDIFSSLRTQGIRKRVARALSDLESGSRDTRENAEKLARRAISDLRAAADSLEKRLGGARPTRKAARKTTRKRTTAKRAPARKSTARKTSARKATTRKAAAPRKTTARKTTARKTTARKAAPRKTTARKAAPRKRAATKKSS